MLAETNQLTIEIQRNFVFIENCASGGTVDATIF